MYIVYKTINKINGKFYVGVHKTNRVEFDGYFGSGKILKEAIKKYGSEAFERKTLFTTDNKKEAFLLEKQIVDDNFILSKETYNISYGGNGGNTIKFLPKEKVKKIVEKREETRKKNFKPFSKEIREKMSISAKNRLAENPHTIPSNKGRIHSEKAKQSFIDSGARLRNTYKTITNGTNERRLNNGEKMPEGWYFGRSNAATERAKNHRHSPETLERISKKNTGKRFFTNGITNIRIDPRCDEIPEGYVPGCKQNKRTKKWYTNGNENIIIYHDSSITQQPIPEGYYEGRIIKKENKNDRM